MLIFWYVDHRWLVNESKAESERVTNQGTDTIQSLDQQIESLKSQYAQQANDLQSVRKELQNAKDAGAAQQRNKNAVDKVKKARQELLESYDKFFDQLKAANAVQEELKKDDVKKLYDELKDAQKTLKDAQAGLEESEGGNQ
jgi:molecular chaperone GrpE (heat shock protein)